LTLPSDSPAALLRAFDLRGAPPDRRLYE
jgi:hypothetical protein